MEVKLAKRPERPFCFGDLHPGDVFIIVNSPYLESAMLKFDKVREARNCVTLGTGFPSWVGNDVPVRKISGYFIEDGITEN